MSNKGKTYLNRLTPEQVREIRTLHYQGKSDYWIAQSMGLMRGTVTRVSRRKAYRNIPDADGGAPEMCPCVQHTEARLQNVNLNNSRAVKSAAVCLACKHRTVATVGDIQSAGGRVFCDRCRGRAK